MADRRLFVGNLPKDVSESALENIFNKYKVSKIDIKRKKVLDDEAVFAFINISSENVDKCLSELRNKKLSNCTLKIEPAKESFLERLKKEHHEKYQSNDKKPNGQVTTPSFQLRQNLNGVKNKKIVFKDEDFEEPAKETTEEIPRRRNLPMFQGTSSVPVVKPKKEPANVETKPFKAIVNVQTSANDAITAMKKFEEFSSVWKDDVMSNFECKKISFKEKPKPDEEMETNRLSFKRSSNNKFSESNNISDDRKEKRWSNNKYTEHNGETNEKIWSNNKQSERKFNNDDRKERKVISWKTSNRSDNQLTEKSSSDQTESQRWGSTSTEDDRFKMDERFSDANDTSASNEKQKRKKSTFDELDNKIKNNSVAKEVFEHRQLVRYDPTRPDHKILEKNVRKTEPSIPDAKKKKTKKKEEKHQSESDKKSEPVKPEVSKEKHYSVADTLKDAFKKTENQSGFSLSSLFDQKLKEDGSSLPIREIGSEKKPAAEYRVENIPQQYSDDESEEEDVEMEAPIDIPSTTASEKVLGKCGVWGETFFFKEDDSRFKEAINFFKPGNESKITDFDKQRSKLRTIVRKKLQNSKKDNKLFKQKLGGKINKSKFKMRLKKARNY